MLLLLLLVCLHDCCRIGGYILCYLSRLIKWLIDGHRMQNTPGPVIAERQILHSCWYRCLGRLYMRLGKPGLLLVQSSVMSFRSVKPAVLEPALTYAVLL
jgi:hypothetical protein